MSDLSARLSEALHSARRAYAAFRPEVARFLFEQGFLPAAAALPDDEPERDALLEALFRLHLESIGSRGFGVSQQSFRDDPHYPDRYFAHLWLDLVPPLLPLLPSARRLSTLVALFNLGEHLSLHAPGLGGVVVERLLLSRDRIVTDGVEPVALSALVDLGFLPAEAAAGAPVSAAERPFTRLALRCVASLAPWEPMLVPGALAFEAGAIRVWDRLEARSLLFSFADGGFQLLGREASQAPEPAANAGSEARLSVDPSGRVEVGGHALGTLDLRGVLGVATDGTRVALTRRFSQRLELYELTA